MLGVEGKGDGKGSVGVSIMEAVKLALAVLPRFPQVSRFKSLHSKCRSRVG